MISSKNLNPKLLIFEYRSYKTFQIPRGFEQLSSTITWQVMMVQTLQKSGASGTSGDEPAKPHQGFVLPQTFRRITSEACHASFDPYRSRN